MLSLNAKTVLGLSVVLVVASLLIAYRVRLRESEEKLLRSSEQVAQLAQLNVKLSNSLDGSVHSQELSEGLQREIMKLRGEVAMLRRQFSEKEKVQQSPASAKQDSSVAVPPEVKIDRDAWGFAGYDSPQSALQSFVWGMKMGNLTAVIDSLEPVAQEALRAKLADKTDLEVSAFLKDQVQQMQAIRLDRIKAASETETSFVLNSQDSDDGSIRTHDEAVLTFRNHDGQWKAIDF
jgi:hypothetical protein